MQQPEAWLRGPVEGVPPPLMPVAHALVPAVDDTEHAAANLDVDDLWMADWPIGRADQLSDSSPRIDDSYRFVCMEGRRIRCDPIRSAIETIDPSALSNARANPWTWTRSRAAGRLSAHPPSPPPRTRTRHSPTVRTAT